VFTRFSKSAAHHLARHSLADLFLDSLPYNAHQTACDALWAGVPVLTCSGRSYASRVAGSLLSAANVPELITTNLDDYERLALDLVHDAPRLRVLRERVRAARNTTLFDMERLCRHVESAYQAMWDRHVRGLQPASIGIEPIRS
jgi:predicted O-linked N-acetylglucosamine transferase (SPINDLY family)